MRGALIMLYVIMCISLYPRRNENSILNSLFWLLALMPVLILISFGFMVDKLRFSEYFSTFKILIDLCLVPLVGFFLLKIVIPDWINIRKALLLLAPTFVFLIVYIVTYNKVVLTFSFIYTALIAFCIFFLIIFISIRYDRYLKDNYSNINNMSVQWVRIVIYIFAAWYLAWCLIVKQNSRWMDSAYYLFLIIIWTFIYKYSIKHITAFNTLELFESVQYESVGLLESDSQKKKIGKSLDLYMNSYHPWLNPTLTLQELAFAINTNRTYLSEYFNRTLNTTFYDYLNNFRIKNACELLISESNLSIIEIGEKSGFNSLSTFRRAFEKNMGCSPAKYRSRNEDV